MKQLHEQQAIDLAKSGWWKECDAQQIVAFQLFQDRLCMDSVDFHRAIEEALGRPVYIHELASSNIEHIYDEFQKESKAPTFDEIVNLIPKAKRIIFGGRD